jgi:hypothetical protein
VAGTGVLYVRGLPNGARPTRVVVRTDPEAAAQVTLARQPDRPHLDVRWQPGDAPDRGRLVVTACGGDVRLRAAAWERVTPVGRGADDTSYRAGGERGASLGGLAGAALTDGQTVVSDPIVLPASLHRAEVVFKILAEDSAGRLVPGWAGRPAAVVP